MKITENRFAILLYLLTVLGSILTVSWLTVDYIGYGIAAACVGIITGIAVLSEKKVTIDDKLLYLFILYYIHILIILAVSSNPQPVILYILGTTAALVIVFAVPPIIYPTRILVPWFLAVLGFLFTIIGIVFLLFGDVLSLNLNYTGYSTYFGYNYRIQSIFSNSNNLGMFLTFGSLSATYLVMRKSSLFNYSLLATNIIGLLLSNGRAALGGFIIGLVIILFHNKTRIISILFIIGAVVFHIIIYIDIVSQEFWANLLSNRNYSIISGINHFLEYPFYGSGFGGIETNISQAKRPPGSHNSYLSILTRTGIGAVFYIIAIIYLLIKSFSLTGTEWQKYIFSCYFSFVTIMIFETITIGGLSVESLLFATFFGLLHYEIILLGLDNR